MSAENCQRCGYPSETSAHTCLAHHAPYTTNVPTQAQLRDPPDARYMRDPVFRVLVDLMHNAMHQQSYTPSELREAAILAATTHEVRCVPTFPFTVKVPR